MIAVLLFGVFIGMKHALESDHIAAVASLATRASSARQIVGLGVAWGCGHTITLLAIGATILAFDTLIPEQVARGLELAVGVMLVLLGADVIRRVIQDRIHVHPHRHGESNHVHAHSHTGDDQHVSSHDHRHPDGLKVRALLVGTVHGMAGSAALMLLTAQTINSFWTGVLYILFFGLGSVVGMAALSAAISLPLRLTVWHLTWAQQGLAVVVAVSTVILGTYVIVDVGMVAVARSAPAGTSIDGQATPTDPDQWCGSAGRGTALDPVAISSIHKAC